MDTRRWWFPLSLAVLTLSLGVVFVLGWPLRPIRWRPVLRVEWVEPHANALAGMVDSQWDGLRLTITTGLECMSHAVVLHDPRRGVEPPPRQGVWQLQSLAQRRGTDLNLGYRIRFSGEPWRTVEGRWLPANMAVRQFMDSLPFSVPLDRFARLLPDDPEAMMALMTYGKGFFGFESPAVIYGRARMLCDRAPGAAINWVYFGIACYQRMLEEGNSNPRWQQEAVSAFEKVQNLWPGCPVAAMAHARLRSDLGEHAQAFRILSDAIARYPRAEGLLRQVAYASRCTGLLDISLKALDAHRLLVDRGEGIENAFLYAGLTERFEKALVDEADQLGWKPAHRFYFGYAAMVRGDRSLALSRFRHPAYLSWGGDRFGRLGLLYEQIASGDHQGARSSLDAFGSFFLNSRLPDGEFLFKLGEASASLGDHARAMDMLQRAASHGFHCLPWYRSSPFLEKLRPSVQFQILVRQMEEKQRYYQQQVSAGDFGL